MNNNHTIYIDGNPVGQDYPPYIIAELSANHNGKLENALKLLEEAKKAGANAIKLQTYSPDTITIDSKREEFRITTGPRSGMSLYELYQQAHTPWEWHEILFRKAKELNITIFSSPFDFSAVEFLEKLNCCAYKIASCELVDIPLIRKVALTGKPIIISTGMGTFDEIKEAIDTVKSTDNKNIIILHCVSGYPTPLEECNLKTIVDLKEKTKCIVGLSDHTSSIDTSLLAVALGASVIEKHFNLINNKSLDSEFSLNKKQFYELTSRVRSAWIAMGNINYDLKRSEIHTSRLRRSLYIVKDIKKGQLLNSDNVKSIRPNNGLLPKFYEKVINMKAKKDIKKGTPLSWDLIEEI